MSERKIKRISVDAKFHQLMKIEAARRGVPMLKLQSMWAQKGLINIDKTLLSSQEPEKRRGDFEFGFL